MNDICSNFLKQDTENNVILSIYHLPTEQLFHEADGNSGLLKWQVAENSNMAMESFSKSLYKEHVFCSCSRCLIYVPDYLTIPDSSHIWVP